MGRNVKAGASQGPQTIKKSACQEGDVGAPLEKGMATHSSILVWEIPDKGAWRATFSGVEKDLNAAYQLNNNKERLSHLPCT